jgi:uncharacterized protein (TIGR02453 family)
VEFLRFEPTILQFLEELTDNNNRPWFEENKRRYESQVLEPSLAFIRAFQPRLQKISPFCVASDRRIGGSLMRVYRDARFAGNQPPYKTNVGIQFRHRLGRDVHAPGFYVHIATDACFLAAGVWRPDRDALARIRRAIVDEPDRWRRAKNDKRFRQEFALAGDALKRAPRDFPADHPWIDDIKRTDFIGLADLLEDEVLSDDFLDIVAARCAAARPLMRFLCRALGVPF